MLMAKFFSAFSFFILVWVKVRVWTIILHLAEC